MFEPRKGDIKAGTTSARASTAHGRAAAWLNLTSAAGCRSRSVKLMTKQLTVSAWPETVAANQRDGHLFLTTLDEGSGLHNREQSPTVKRQDQTCRS